MNIYTDPISAVRSAYRSLAADIIKTSSVFTVRPGSGVNPWDKLAQGTITLGIIHKTLDATGTDLVGAVYMPPIGRLVQDKELLAKSVSYRLFEEFDHHSAPRWWIHDQVCRYCNLTPAHDDQWWANHLGKDIRSLQRWRSGNPQRRQRGLLDILDSWHGSAIDRVSEALRLSGLID